MICQNLVLDLLMTLVTMAKVHDLNQDSLDQLKPFRETKQGAEIHVLLMIQLIVVTTVRIIIVLHCTPIV